MGREKARAGRGKTVEKSAKERRGGYFRFPGNFFVLFSPFGGRFFIMSASKTKCFGLHVWEGGDDFLRSEFNENFAALDGALAGLREGKAELVMGTYAGDGAAQRVIELGFAPRAVVATTNEGTTYTSDSSTYGGLALRDAPLRGRGAYGGRPALVLGETGFTVYYTPDAKVYTNSSSDVFHFLAVR